MVTWNTTIIPATFGEVTETIEVERERVEIETLPATYRTETKRVKVKEATQRWNPICPQVLSADANPVPANCLHRSPSGIHQRDPRSHRHACPHCQKGHSRPHRNHHPQGSARTCQSRPQRNSGGLHQRETGQGRPTRQGHHLPERGTSSGHPRTAKNPPGTSGANARIVRSQHNAGKNPAITRTLATTWLL